SLATQAVEVDAILPVDGHGSISGQCHTSLLRLLPAHRARNFEHAFLSRDGYVLQRWRKRDRHVHRAHALYGSIKIIKCASGYNRRDLRGDAVAFVTFIEHDRP